MASNPGAVSTRLALLVHTNKDGAGALAALPMVSRRVARAAQRKLDLARCAGEARLAAIGERRSSIVANRLCDAVIT